MRLQLAALLLSGSALAAPANLNAQRRATIAAVAQYIQTHPRFAARCGLADGEAKSEAMAFPRGSAARMYQKSGGRLFEFGVTGSQVRLLWCGTTQEMPGSPLPPALKTALHVPVQTKVGHSMREPGGLDVYDGFNAALTVSRVDGSGKTLCSKVHIMPNATLSLPSPDNLRYGCP